MVTYPADWEIDKVSNISDITTGCRDTQDNIYNGRYPFFVRSPIVERINVSDFDCEAVLTAGDGVGTGKVFHYINGKFAAHQRVYVMSDFRKVTGKYFYYYFSRNFINEVEKYTAKSSVDSVRRAMIAEMEFPHPSLPEQNRIVENLSCFDDYIDDLAELIEKKKGIRDGALEDLMSGRTRLEGFDDGWVENSIDEVTQTIITGGTPATAHPEYYGGKIPWLSSTEIHQKRVSKPTAYITEIGLQNSSAKIAPSKSVLIALAGQGKTRGTAAYLLESMALNQSLAALVTNEKCDSEFLFYLIESLYLYLRELSSGDGGRGGLNKKLIKAVVVKMPGDVAEQKAIAAVLTAMDDEIEALEAERDKMIQIREGAMDDLLTGRVHLTV
ncbi:MAG: restriction endonuclease subunit S [Lachnospiraceae bacterium]|nr:restriction endonuclease subunit S [Lachnospiraceae bacterium]